MISAINPYPPIVSFRDQGNASMDYLNLALVVDTSRKLQDTTREFISTFNPQKLYLNIQNINNRQPKNFISTYV